MDSDRQQQIRLTLRRLAESQVATVDFLQQTLRLFDEEFALDPVAYFRRTVSPPPAAVTTRQMRIDPTLLSVTIRGKTCFLGNNYPFRLLLRLAQKQNTYVSRQKLFDVVWEGERSEEALRSTVKVLRKRLREAGLAGAPAVFIAITIAAARELAAGGDHSAVLPKEAWAPGCGSEAINH